MQLFLSYRPYHGVLLLVDGQNLLDSLSTDCTPALNRLINVIIQPPIRSLQIIALEADLSLSQVYYEYIYILLSSRTKFSGTEIFWG